jgi:mono/diheme cytochrome c family protein
MTSRWLLRMTTAGAGCLWAGCALAQAVTPAPFTQAQADAGRREYADSCVSCHGDNLQGKGPPPLAGKEFAAASLGKGTVGQLYAYIQKSMPFCQGGSLATTAYLDIVAFILEANGAKPGNEPLTPAASVKVSDIITGETPPGFLNKPK